MYPRPYLVRFVRYSLRQVQNRSILLPVLRLTHPTEKFPFDDLRKILYGGQRMAKVDTGEEILPKASTPLSRVHERYRRQTDRRNCESKVGMGGTHGTHGIPRYQISRYQYRGGHGIPSRSRYFTVLFRNAIL